MNQPKPTPDDHAALIRRYFDACNAGNYDALVDCFTPDAVHYFPAGLPEVPWRTAETIAKKWVWCVENLGSQWTIERIIVSHTTPEAMIEWTHWKTKSGTALRGAEWYDFDPVTGKIAEIRAYYASPADPSVTINELVDFPYGDRGYHLTNANREKT